ncbi:MAG: preprotein translocase, SecG subunit [Frankiales bacterium]|nr:preprotein translocase, SecG subunit [Frankiales bacterium]
MVTFLSIILVFASLGMVVLVLLHKGKGGGLSNMFGGGVSSSLGGSAVVEKNLDRLTIICGLVWFTSVVAIGLLLKQTS